MMLYSFKTLTKNIYYSLLTATGLNSDGQAKSCIYSHVLNLSLVTDQDSYKRIQIGEGLGEYVDLLITSILEIQIHRPMRIVIQCYTI